MKHFIKTNFVVSLTALLVLLANFSLAWSWQAQCTDVAARGYLNVLTINLLFSEVEDREIRLENITFYSRTGRKRRPS